MGVTSSDLDIFSDAFLTDPYPYLDELRRAGPVIWLEHHQVWMITRYDPAVALLSDATNFCNSGGVGITNYFKSKPWRPPSIILEADAPLHTRTRAVLTKILSPLAARRMRSDFEAEAEAFVDAALAKGEVDAIDELAIPFPLKALPDALGMVAHDRHHLVSYGRMVGAGFGPAGPAQDAAMVNAPEILSYIDTCCDRANLSADGLGAQIYAMADGEALNQEEAKMLVRSFLSAGVDTTFNALSQTFCALVDHPEQWALLRADPGLARAAFDEALRYDGSAQGVFRTAVRDVEFAGAQIGMHDKVLVSFGSANRDPDRWDQPDRYDIMRKTTGHLGFGTGLHGCVAQMIARMEGEALFGALARAVADIQEAGPRVRRLAPGARGLDHLPLRLTGKTA